MFFSKRVRERERDGGKGREGGVESELRTLPSLYGKRGDKDRNFVYSPISMRSLVFLKVSAKMDKLVFLS